MSSASLWKGLWVLIAVSAFGLGLTGACREQLAAGVELSIPRAVLSALALFALDFGGLVEPRDGFALTAAYLALLSTATGVAVGARTLFGPSINRWRASRASGHAVLVGFGRHGSRALRELLADGWNVVLVESSESQLSQACALHPGMPLIPILGNAVNSEVLQQARVESAELLVVTPQNDLDILDAWLESVKLHPRRKSSRAFFRMSTEEHRQAFMEAVGSECEPRVGSEASWYDEQVSLVRRALRECPPDGYNLGVHWSTAQLVVGVVARGRRAKNFLLELAHVAHYANRHRVRVMVFSCDPCSLAESSSIHTCLEVDWCVPVDWASVRSEIDRCHDGRRLDVVYADLETTEDVLRLRRRGSPGYPIVGMCDQRFSPAVLGTLLSAEIHQEGNAWSELEALDRIARVCHENYRANNPEAAMPVWEDLGVLYREANRRTAMHLEVKLRALGYRLAQPGEACQETPGCFEEARIQALGAMEHSRWMAEKLLAGVVKGPKRVAGVSHPDLVPWEELDSPARDKDMEMFRCIPDVLRECDLGVCALDRDDPEGEGHARQQGPRRPGRV